MSKWKNFAGTFSENCILILNERKNVIKAIHLQKVRAHICCISEKSFKKNIPCSLNHKDIFFSNSSIGPHRSVLDNKETFHCLNESKTEKMRLPGRPQWLFVDIKIIYHGNSLSYYFLCTPGFLKIFQIKELLCVLHVTYYILRINICANQMFLSFQPRLVWIYHNAEQKLK